jgi:hypothetical protein
MFDTFLSGGYFTALSLFENKNAQQSKKSGFCKEKGGSRPKG